MARLIDADEAKKLIFGIDSCFAEFVDNIPTAYDVDAVVRELEEGYESNVGKLKMISVDKPIEVVKRGGRNE